MRGGEKERQGPVYGYLKKDGKKKKKLRHVSARSKTLGGEGKGEKNRVPRLRRFSWVEGGGGKRKKKDEVGHKERTGK